MSDRKTKLEIEVRSGDRVDRRSFSTDSVTLGSGAKALFRLESSPLAELHAVLNVEATGAIQLLDLGAGGLTVDGKPVTTAVIPPGGSFSIGDVHFTVHADAPHTHAFDDEEATNVSAQPPMPPVAKPTVRDDDEPTDPGVDEVTDPSAGVAASASAPEELSPLDKPEDVMALVIRSGTSSSNLGIEPKRPKVLEVNQIWEDVLLDTKHFVRETPKISIGSAVGWKWNLLGVDMGWVPAPLNLVLRYTPPMWSEVNSDWRNDFYAPDDNLPDGNEHNLFQWNEEGNKFEAHVSAKWDGFADVGEKRMGFEDLIAAGKATRKGNDIVIPVEEDTRVMVDVNGVVFYGHMVKAGKRVVSRVGDDLDYAFLALTMMFGMIGILFSIIVYMAEGGGGTELVEVPDRFVNLVLEMPKPEEKEKKKPSGNPDAGEGAKAKREEGKVGKKDAKMEKAKGDKVEMRKQEMDRQVAENAGVLGALQDGAAFDGIFGSSALSSDITGGIGGLTGAKGVQVGNGGLGSRGSGLGGGGTAEGLGGMGTKGVGSGASGYGSGGGNFGAKGEGGIGSMGGDPIILGALDRSLIDEVIKRHMNQIRYCYQRELTKDPALGGKIVIKFTIAKDGTVSSASTKSTTMNNAAVQTCIEGRFMKMQFPQPKGGGIVVVSYPFMFSPG